MSSRFVCVDVGPNWSFPKCNQLFNGPSTVYLLPKFHENPSITFWVILVANTCQNTLPPPTFGGGTKRTNICHYLIVSMNSMPTLPLCAYHLGLHVSGVAGCQRLGHYISNIRVWRQNHLVMCGPPPPTAGKFSQRICNDLRIHQYRDGRRGGELLRSPPPGDATATHSWFEVTENLTSCSKYNRSFQSRVFPDNRPQCN